MTTSPDKNIFIVEDDKDIRELIIMLLSEQRWQVSGFPDIESFKKGLEQSMPDLILLDVMLPDGNGIELCKELNGSRETQRIPVILMSANIHYKTQLHESYAKDFLPKPFDIEELIRRVGYSLAN